MTATRAVSTRIASFATTIDSPIGELTLTRNARGLSSVLMTGERNADAMIRDDHEWTPEGFDDAIAQLREYFAGTRTEFTLTTTAEGTNFQRRVWAELCRIPFGETISYGELARRIDNPAAVRAVGLANGRNPLSIIVPCHRVIGANGSLTGYGGGLANKEWLLRHEGALPALSARTLW
jgi:methylated-DNA-[protein]-cysteine S-methyltransferase